MANYFILDARFNLVIGVISASTPPAKDKSYRFLPASDKTLDSYFKWLKKHPDTHPDLAELASKSHYLNEIFNPYGRKIFPTFPKEDWEPSPPAANAREAAIASWLDLHPKADENDLSEQFNTGLVAAKAYIAKYRIAL